VSTLRPPSGDRAPRRSWRVARAPRLAALLGVLVPVIFAASPVLAASPARVAAPAPAGSLSAEALARGAKAEQAAPQAFTAKLDSISNWTGPDRPLRVRLTVHNRGSTALSGLQVRLLAGDQVNSRSELQQRLTSQPPIYGRQVETLQLGGDLVVAPGASRRLPGLDFDLPASFGIGHAGAVVPIRLEVAATTPAVTEPARVDTFAVYVSEPVAQPLRASLLVQLHEPTHQLPDGTFADDRLAGLLGPNGAIGNLVDVLQRPETPPVDVMLDGLLLEEATAMSGNGWKLRADASGRVEEVPGSDPRSQLAFGFNQRLGSLAGNEGMALYALPYANADLVALARNGLAKDAETQILAGRSEIEQRLGRAPDPTLAFPFNGLVDRSTLGILSSTGATTVVLNSAQVPGTAAVQRTPNAVVDVTTPGRRQRALVPDQALSAALADQKAGQDPAVLAQRIVAESAMAWLEQPNRRTPRGVLLAPPATWRPNPAFLSNVLRGLGGAPWLRMVGVKQLGQEVRPEPGSKPRPLSSYSPRLAAAELPARYLATVRSARGRLESFASSAGEGFDELQELERGLLIAESADYRHGAARSRGTLYVRAVERRLRDVYAQVGVEDTPVVLTARKGPLQITTFNRSDVPLTVRLRLSSERVEATQPVSEPFELPANGGHTQRVEVETRVAGNYPVFVELLTADGRQVIGSGSIMVRSTAVARVTLLLIGGAGGFLVVWWARKLIKRRPGGDSGPGAGAGARARPSERSNKGEQVTAGAGAGVKGDGGVGGSGPSADGNGSATDSSGGPAADGDGRPVDSPGRPATQPDTGTDQGTQSPSRSVNP
jgi:hypothetical protein